MVAPLEVLAVVQARGGSKSLPGKNVKLLAGHPLIAWSIAAGHASARVTRLIVSTDSSEIADVARTYGAEVPFLRPPALAEDASPDLPLFQHALGWLEAHEGYRPDLVVQLRPTSPLRPAGLIDEAVEILAAHEDADCVRGVTTPGQTPYKMWRIAPDGLMRPLMTGEFAEPYNMPRQELPAVYWQTGHIDVIRRRTITDQISLTGTRVLPIVIDRAYAVDIDTEADWQHAEARLADPALTPVRPPEASDAPAAPDQVLAGARLLVLDFDGVLTDNRVWTSEDGTESVACDRSDGLGIEMVRRAGIEVVVLSKERNRVVEARCRKLGITCCQGIDDKPTALRELVASRDVELDHVVYVGNDVNDVECLVIAGCGVVVSDAHPAAAARADLVLAQRGGHGAVRAICDRLLHLRAKKEEPR